MTRSFHQSEPPQHRSLRIYVHAYFPLSDSKTPTVSELEKGWVKHKTEIRKVQYYYKKPIITLIFLFEIAQSPSSLATKVYLAANAEDDMLII